MNRRLLFVPLLATFATMVTVWPASGVTRVPTNLIVTRAV